MSNRNSSERIVKYIELSNRKIKDKNENVSKEEALSIADEIFNKEFSRKNSGDVIVCERVMFWSVIFEDTGTEYSIDKEFKTKNVWLIKIPIPAENVEGISKNISENEAFEISKQAFKSYLEQPVINSPQDLENYVTYGCEMRNAWRVYFADKSSWYEAIYPNSNPPDYLIDKRTGKILFDSKKPENNSQRLNLE